MRQRTYLIVAVVGIVGLVSASAMAQAPGYNPFSQQETEEANEPKGKANVIASMELVDHPVTMIFRMVSDLTGWSIVLSPEVSSSPPKINLWIKSMTPQEVLDEVVVLGELVKEREGNVITIYALDEYARIHGMEKQIVRLKYADAQEVAKILTPYAAKEASSKIMVSESTNTIVMLVHEPLLKSFRQLVEILDVPLERDVIKIVNLEHQEASVLIPLLEGFLRPSGQQASRNAERRPTATSGPAEPIRAGQGYMVQFMSVPRLNLVALRGLAYDIEKTTDLIASLDVPDELQMATFQLRYVEAGELVKTIKQILETGGGGKEDRTRMRVAVSEQNNRVLFEGPPADIARARELIQFLDQPAPPSSGTIRIYRLDNATSGDVASVLGELIRQEEDDAPLGRRPTLQTSLRPNEQGISRVGPLRRVGEAPSAEATASVRTGDQPAGGDEGPVPVVQEGPRITNAPEINAVIVRATPSVHEQLALLIEELDRPRDQVLLEVTLVTLRADDGLNLGLDLAGANVNGKNTDLIGFTNFGIGQVDTATGALRLPSDPSFGASVAFFDSDDFGLVLNALQTVADARLSSSPKIVVEDNAEAEISQVSQEPFEVTEQGETTTLTSFGGYVDAGTRLQITPHIAEDAWLRMEYSVTLSSFGARASPALPPPRTQNDMRGTVRVPAERVVVLGGLTRGRRTDSVDKVPLLGDIPVLGELFKNRVRRDNDETLFVFIRPVVMRDPSFRDLISISDADIRAAKLDSRDAPSNPMKTLDSIQPEPHGEM